MADWIDDLVEWQIQQGIRRGEYQRPPKPPAARTVAYSVVAALPPDRPWWLTRFRHAFMLRRR
ncbi:hypothetical protein [Nocardia gipuzkoensis]|uniref:hypothetical protein n=1 Tax=Nocardia gipuzkoensis TaxID=2749991 RepID=UPI00237D5AD4|nr:hypothetical protein [Nocardia gipuzkoensis]MDE1673778.1 hypothetical protein [Nocardia gipuzkoensis]